LASQKIPPRSAPASIPGSFNLQQSYGDFSNSVLSQSSIPVQEKKNLNRNESLRIFDSYFDMNDSDGESTGTLLSHRKLSKKNKALHKSLPNSRAGSFAFDGFHNLLDQGSTNLIWNQNESRSALTETEDKFPIGTPNHFPMEKSQESLMMNTDINDKDYINKNNHQMINVHQNRDYLLKVRSKLKSPGVSIGKTMRSDDWMGGQHAAKDEHYVNRRVKFPDGTPVIVKVIKLT
jgi:hypothetical protein